jgi:hypothetical protein
MPRPSIQESVDAIAASFPTANVQKRPSFPDMLRQPNLLIVPNPGRLIAVFAYLVEPSIRQVSYEAIEDVFEAKLVIGESTVVAGLMVGEPRISWRQEALLAVLHDLCDVFGKFEGWAPQAITQDFVPMLINGTPNKDRSPLWTAERKFVSTQLRRFRESKYLAVCDAERSQEFVGDMGEKRMLAILQRLFADNARTDVDDARGEYSLARTVTSRKIARFDFLIGNIPTEFFSSRREAVPQRVRRLMAKARLLRYRDPSQGVDLLPLARLLLIVDGNIAGPSRDRFRYARALVSAGWEIIHTSQLDSLPQLIAHGDF